MNQPVPEKYRLFAIWDCVDPAHVAKLKGKKCFYIIYPLSKVSDLKDTPKKLKTSSKSVPSTKGLDLSTKVVKVGSNNFDNSLIKKILLLQLSRFVPCSKFFFPVFVTVCNQL